LKEILHLRKLKNLQVLWLSENPVAKNPQYRLFCVKNLPNLIKLDDKNISPEEREMARNTHDFDGRPLSNSPPLKKIYLIWKFKILNLVFISILDKKDFINIRRQTL